jgi:hypothetical protein
VRGRGAAKESKYNSEQMLLYTKPIAPSKASRRYIQKYS